MTMPRVRNAQQAVEIARGFLESANVAFYVISSTTLEGESWVVTARSFGMPIRLKISRGTGEVTEHTQG